MSLLTILRYPDPRLATVARPVAQVDDRIRTLVDDMLQTMAAAQGIGLAATQVDVHERVIVIDLSESERLAGEAAADAAQVSAALPPMPLVLINPRLLDASSETVISEEGCLSVPAIYDKVERPARVVVSALDRDGQPQRIEATGLLAVCIQHEMDHLEGRVFVEYLSPLKRNRIRTKMHKRGREAEAA